MKIVKEGDQIAKWGWTVCERTGWRAFNFGNVFWFFYTPKKWNLPEFHGCAWYWTWRRYCRKNGIIE